MRKPQEETCELEELEPLTPTRPKRSTKFEVGETITWIDPDNKGYIQHGKVTSINSEFKVYMVKRSNNDGTFTPKAVDFTWARFA